MLLRRLFANSIRSMSTAHRINSAAMLVIGDEILNGKIQDTNSHYFAKYCFDLGIDLRRIAVVPDESSDLIDTLNQLRKKYDFIVTTGGIGPTHDDITYESIAEAFHLPLKFHDETISRMNRLSRHPPDQLPPDSDVLHAQLRMARFPAGDNVEVHFLSPNLWVPIVALDSQVYVFPGIPLLYQQMLDSLKPFIAERVDGPKLFRKYVSTTSSESTIASLLTHLHEKYAPLGVKIGSYPHFKDKKNTVSIIGPDRDIIYSIVTSVIESVDDGHEVTQEEEQSSS